MTRNPRVESWITSLDFVLTQSTQDPIQIKPDHVPNSDVWD